MLILDAGYWILETTRHFKEFIIIELHPESSIQNPESSIQNLVSPSTTQIAPHSATAVYVLYRSWRSIKKHCVYCPHNLPYAQVWVQWHRIFFSSHPLLLQFHYLRSTRW